jgi:hypothetical protein
MGEIFAPDQYNAPGPAAVDQYGSNDMSDLSKTMQYPPLDAKSLIDSGAIRVVRHPLDTSNDQYSIVTRWNDQQPGSVTPNWPNKPEAYDAAQAALANPRSGALYDGKYRQILWSLRNGGS